MNKKEKVLRILVVDDSEDDVELICAELNEGGFRVVHERVETSIALRAALEGRTWDVVVCDHNLPDLDSMSVLQVVREVAELLPFIVVSGHIPDDTAVRVMQGGAGDFIHKSNLSRLVPVVERELQQAMVRTDLTATQNKLHRVSNFDSLTGLPNRENLFKCLSVKTVQDQPFAVFMIDLNRFRQITKSLGMWAGNRVLSETAERLRRVLGEKNFIARLGADTFVAVVPDLKSRADAGDIAKAIHQCMDEAFRIDGHTLFVKASMGSTFYPADGRRLDDLLKNAESALHSAKANGGASYLAYSPEMDALGIDKLVMETALYHALEHGQFVLHYQHQFDLASNRIVGAEALIRWQHPELGLVPPGEFISILEETGLIVPVGEWVLRTACAQSRQWQDAGLPPIFMAVNLSVMQFRQHGLALTVRRILHETGLSPEFLQLEITENIAMHAEEGIIPTLDELRAIGIQIAIDDFGTGYSSLSYLKRFPIDKLKIDQSFVRDLQEGVNDDGLVTAIIGMGRSLKLKVIAEGVETEEQADILRRNGCDEAQGYLYGKPMAHAEFALLLA